MFCWSLSAGVSLRGCIPDRLSSLTDSLTGVPLPNLFRAFSGEVHSGSTGLLVQLTLGCGVAFLDVHFDDSFKLFTVWKTLSFETVNDDGTRRGVALFLFGWAPAVIPGVTAFCPLQFCCIGIDALSGDDMASNSLVKEMQVFVKSEFSVVCRLSLQLRVFDVSEIVKVFVASLVIVLPLQGVSMSLFTTGVLNWRFLIGVLACGVPGNYHNLLFIC